MTKFLKLFFASAFPLLILLLSDCRKVQFGKGSLTFSTDTLTFDTVFTSLGSTTRYFKVFNTDKKAVKISDIRLMHEVGNQFRINVDGVNGDHFTEVEIPAKDSIYVFVEVTVDPTNATTPFLIIDDVAFQANGNTETVHLQAFGQNAHFHYGEEILTGQTINWANDLPHVIVSHDSVPGVFVDCGGTLNIRPGCKIFFAGNSAIFVQGTLNAVANSWSDSIVFQGARLEEYYEDKPGQWFGIVFLRDSMPGSCAISGVFDHCIINESSYGIYAGAGLSTDLNTYRGVAGRPVVTINNCIIKNSQNNAVYGFNANITSANSIFYAAGEYLMKFGLGGEYSFTHCTIVNNGSKYISHSKEVLLLSNFVADANNNVYPEPITTNFTNCVVYGSLQNEISFNNIYNDTLTNFSNAFLYSDVKARQDTFEMFTVLHDHILFNEDPIFKNSGEGDFTPSDTNGTVSPLIDFCPTILSNDIFGNTRVLKTSGNPLTPSDIGAVEAQ